MYKYLLLLCLPLLFSCTSEQEKKQREKNRQREELRKNPNEPLNDLTNSSWTSEVLSDCHDTLKFTGPSTAILHSCETGVIDNLTYNVNADTVTIDLHSGKADSSPEDIVHSRWKLVMKEGKLLFTYIGHKYEEEFQEVKPAIYTTITTFQKVP